MQRLGLRFTSASTRAPSSAPCFTSSLGIRKLHQLKPLPYPVEEGLGKFLPPDALKVQLQWQDGLLERLNEQVAHTSEASFSLIQTIINLAGNKSKILAFNYASLALNNDFFLDKLKPPPSRAPTHEHEIASDLMQKIREHHGGIEQLRSAFSAAALGTFTNGWVWFVSDQAGNTSTTTTYGPSTLLVRSRTTMWRDPAPTDDPRLPASAFPLSGGDMPLASSSPKSLNSDASFMSSATSLYSTGVAKLPKANNLHTGELLYPLFCLPMYEHAWMSAGYGVWGKEQWLKEFWSVLDWRKVNAVYEDILSNYQSNNYS